MSLFQDGAVWARRYRRLSTALLAHECSWSRSLLQSWSGPGDQSFAPTLWIDSLRALNEELLARFDDEETPGPLERAVPDLAEQLEELDAAARIFISAPALPAPRLRTPRLSLKKQHEIAAIVPFMQAELSQLRISQFIDLGGGMGHLARHLIEATGLPVRSIDAQAKLQEDGQLQQDLFWPSEITAKLTFQNCLIKGEAQAELDPYFTKDSCSVGLHTCGPLAWHQLEKSTACRALLNVACCFDRLDPEADFPRSEEGRQQSLRLSSHALFLATRGRKGKSRETFQFQRGAQSFRFGLHLLLQELGLSPGFLSVGNAPRESYRQGFAYYARERCQRLDLPLLESHAALEAFYKDAETEIETLFLTDLLRGRFARPLEALLLTDRALWLSERGWRAALIEFFDRAQSPRNVGLYAVQSS